MNQAQITEAIKKKVIVSCQALEGEPLYVQAQSIMYLMARAAKLAGAAAIRTNGVRDVVAIREETGLPVIGLIKKKYPDIDAHITPTMAEVDALVEARADVIALDCTMRPREGGISINQFIEQIRRRHGDVLLMADISTYEEGVNACEQGVDFVGTTMSGYTPYSPALPGPDFALVRRLAADISCPLIAEGKVHTPQEAAQLLKCGAHAVVVGGAITRPLEIATRFVDAVREAYP